MKINKTRFVVAALVICSTGALAGSISSTIAWYQYSTRISAVYLGASAGANGNLKVRIKGTDKWLADIGHKDVADYLKSVEIGQEITPVTSGDMSADDPLIKDNQGNPVFYFNPNETTVERVRYDATSWKQAEKSMYVVLPLEICYMVKNDSGNSFQEKDVYISNLLIQEDYKNKANENHILKDLSASVRVHLSSYQSNDLSENHIDTACNRLISKNGGSILTEGYLDMDGDGRIDEYVVGNEGPDYQFDPNAERHYITYGENHQTSYSNKYNVQDGSYQTLDGQTINEKVYPMVVETQGASNVLVENNLNFVKEGDSEPTSKSIGKTVAFDNMENEAYLNVIMTIWVEGWEPLPSPTTEDPDAKSCIWSVSDYVGSMFDVGIEFAVQSEL